MTSTTAISLPRFLPLRSFLAHGVGEEGLQLRSEFAAQLPPPAIQIVRKAAA